MWINILYACLVMIFLSLFTGLGIAVANIYFDKTEDNRILDIENKLPGYNCGACGYINCERFAKAIVDGEVKDSAVCRVSTKKQREQLIEFAVTIKYNDGEPIILE